jgi:putative ABC transport system permease protein
MISKLLQYVWRSIGRQKTRSALTVLGIATAMFLFCFIEGLQKGVSEATESSATANQLIVYQQSRFCPATSKLPERYAGTIAKLPGVVSVLPIKIYVNNCRASLDSVTFRGVPPDSVTDGRSPVTMVSGSIADFKKRRDGALVGSRLASRRNLKVGDRYQIGNVAVGVSGIFTSTIPGDDNMAYVNLEYLQRAAGVDSLGHVTEFNVTVNDPKKAETLSREIDDLFKSDEVPTTTKTHKAFITSATGDLLGLVRFTRWLGFLCVGVVLSLTANTVYVMVQDRIKEHAVLQTLGFTGIHLFFMVLVESTLLSLMGGILGTGVAALALHFGHLGLGAEGVQIAFVLAPVVIVIGLLVSTVTGILAGIVPAIQAACNPIVDSLRRV